VKVTIRPSLLALIGVLGCGSTGGVGAAPLDPPAAQGTSDAAVLGALDAGSGAGSPAAGPAPAPDASIPSPPLDGTPCQVVTASHHVEAPEILIVLDRSGSMVGFGTELGANRWDPSKQAVVSITGQFQDVIAFGLSMFAAPDPSGIDLFSCAAGGLDVPLMTGTAGAIAQAMEGATPLGGATPTGATLEAAARVLGARMPKPGAKLAEAYVLLVTDGEPTCEEGPLDTTPAAIARANAAVEGLAASGVKTYVIGYGVSTAAETMNGFAQRGGTERYYPVESGEQLAAELRRITGEVVTCAYQLERAPRDVRKVLVELDDAQLNLDPADGNGWRLEGTTVRLLGTSCASLKDGTRHQVRIQEVCDVVPII
jgi:hypothetical protein